MLIHDLFEKDVTRDIPPVVYFHEQSPIELAREVDEYIITGGYPAGDPRATEDGIHEQFVRLLNAIARELKKPGGPELPACWISGFYGSGKSSFAKLLGLSLDGHKVPSGKALADALLAQDHSPASTELRAAWEKVTAGRPILAVVFDVGSNARDEEQIHTVIVRQVQKRLRYSSTRQLVADHELKLELEGLYEPFLEKARAVHGKSWDDLKDSQLAEDYFSAALHALQPDLYRDAMSWIDSRSGSSYQGKRSAAEAVLAIQHMVDQRAVGRTLFIVVDEVSQYVHDNEDRMSALQGFVESLGHRLRGRGWFLATGQQQLEQGVGQQHPILKLKDRFPPALRVHLGVANIRDVVHKRLLRKKKLVEGDLRDLFQKHRTDLSLYAYKGDQIAEADFVDVYPMLPGHIPLLLDITTGLRGRSSRVQGDSHAIRGLLQLLGDLFRGHDLARREVGQLLTIDLVYDVLHTALDPDVQMTLARAFDFCRHQGDRLMERVVKAVALLELVQDHQKTDTELIARSLYSRLGDPNNRDAVQRALDALRGESLLGYSEQKGYKIESSAGQEWQRERDGYVPSTDQISEQIQKSLDPLIGDVEGVPLAGLAVPWLVLYTDAVGSRERHLRDPRKPTVITLDLQFTKGAAADVWVPRSDTGPHRDRVIWVVGDVEGPKHAAERLVRSLRMVELYGRRESSLRDEQARLLIEERNRSDTALKELRDELQAALLAGEIFFRGRQASPREHGASFPQALAAFGQRVIGELYPNPVTFAITNKDVLFLFDNVELSGPPPVLCQDRLGILSLDAGRYEVTCSGRVPTDVLGVVKELPGVSGSSIIAQFGGPPHGIAPDVVRAAVIGLLRGGKIRVELEGIGELTSVRDEGARELLSDGGFKKAKLFENAKTTLQPRDRTAICQLFKDCLGVEVARDNDAIADAVMQRFAGVRERLNGVAERFRKLPKDTAYPEALTKLEKALESCRRDRKVEPTVLAVKRALPQLRDGLGVLRRMETDLSEESIERLREAESMIRFVWPSLKEVAPTEEAKRAASAIDAHLSTERPWEDTRDLAGPLEVVREEYRARRRAVLDHHAEALELLVLGIKRREGFERLSPDQQYSVTRHLREGAAANTDERAIAPALESLSDLLAMRRHAGEEKALLQLDALLETVGESPVVEVTLELSGREIRTPAELERALEALRQRVLAELASHHRVRLK